VATTAGPRTSTSTPTFKRPQRELPFPLNLYQTTVGRKWVMAVTGIMLLGFVLVHMIGNLHLYEGPLEVHEYAEGLRDIGGDLVPRTLALWLLRVGLIGAFGLHIHAATTLHMTHNSTARGTSYQSKRDWIAANFASRTMRYTGPIIGLYLLFHLADLTWGWLNPDYVRGDPYHNVVESMANWPVALIYIAANVALAIHIFHGTWSLFQTLGLNAPVFNRARRGLATGLAGLILLGNLSFPILVTVNVLDEDNRQTPVPPTSHSENDSEASEGSRS